MMNQGNSLLGEATQEELTACIRLLALSVVQHRATHSFVPFRDSVDQLRPGGNNAEKAGLIVAGRNAVEEALELVRVIAADSPLETDPEPDSAPPENRKQLRINVTAPIKLIWPGDDSPTVARLQNISWGGASIMVNEVRMDKGDTLQILLPGTKGTPINIEAKFLRSWNLAPGEGEGEGIAVRFSSLATRDEDELEAVLKLLAQSADNEGLRQHARLTQRLDIQFDGDELRATLDDISAGGLCVTLPDPLQIGQSLQAVISTFDEGCSLKLRARVVRQETIRMGKTELYQAGLKFEHPTEELNQLTRDLVSEMIVNRR
ncbi:MAG: PilZ domain-containing protein [Halioglobus sp.]